MPVQADSFLGGVGAELSQQAGGEGDLLAAGEGLVAEMGEGS